MKNIAIICLLLALAGCNKQTTPVPPMTNSPSINTGSKSGFGRPVFVSVSGSNHAVIMCNFQHEDKDDNQKLSDQTVVCAVTNVPSALSSIGVRKTKLIQVAGEEFASNNVSLVAIAIKAAGYTNVDVFLTKK